jgi:D-sedoheptulose 7-phosphate isomerase
MTGYDGGKLSKTARFSFDARVDDMQVSEDLHMVAVHLLMKVLLSSCKTTVPSCSLGGQDE